MSAQDWLWGEAGDGNGLLPQERLGPEPSVNAGWSTCPVCHRTWWVTPVADCLLPACGCYGDDLDPSRRDRPCHGCGLSHALTCPAMKGTPS